MGMYHEGSRALQDRFGSRALADRLVDTLRRERFTEADRQFIESRTFFFVATADADGHPDCSYKGGPPGFVRVVAPDLLVYPDYDGNGMFKTLGNFGVNPNVGLLFIAFEGKPQRLRVNGAAVVSIDDPLREEFVGAQAIVRVTPRDIFPNCPRYIPRMSLLESSPYLPQTDCAPVEPQWKSFPQFRDVVPPRKA